MIDTFFHNFLNRITGNVTRVEVIDEFGRSYVKHGVANVQMSIQDDGRTMKIFIAPEILRQNP